MTRTILLLVIVNFFAVTFVSFTAKSHSDKNFRSDTIPSARKKITDDLLVSLGSRSQMTAEAVYKNIQLFKGENSITAKQLLDTMQYWCSSLDITCDYCHTKNDYASEQPSAKQITRDMFHMQATINKDLLRKIKNLATDAVVINCYTCHHGSALPDN